MSEESMELAGRVVLANAGGGPDAAAAVIAAAMAADKDEIAKLRRELATTRLSGVLDWLAEDGERALDLKAELGVEGLARLRQALETPHAG